MNIVSDCTAAGGQNIEVTVTMTMPVEGGQSMNIEYNNWAYCVGASCDADEVIAVYENTLSASSRLTIKMVVEDSGNTLNSSSKAKAAFSALAVVAGALFMA